MIKNFFTDLLDFVKNVSKDERIPERDKKVILALIAYIVSPIDFIPDWIPVIGLLDDFIALGLLLDYFFNILDSKILLSHFPWDLKAYSRLRRIARFITMFTPSFIQNYIWKYEKGLFD